MPETKRIKVSSEPKQKQGQNGPLLSVGYYVGQYPNGRWENYLVKDRSLFPLFKKGNYVQVEYEVERFQDAEGTMVTINKISGAAPADAPGQNKDYGGSSGGGAHKSDPSERSSTQRQALIYAIANNADKFTDINTWGDVILAVTDSYPVLYPNEVASLDQYAQKIADKLGGSVESVTTERVVDDVYDIEGYGGSGQATGAEQFEW